MEIDGDDLIRDLVNAHVIPLGKKITQTMTMNSHQFDIGLIVGRYFQALGVLSLASMLFALVFGQFYFDVSFVFLLWVGNALIRHSRVARTLTLIMVSLICIVGAAIIVAILVRGTKGVTTNFGPWVFTEPPIELAVCGLLIVITFAAFPLYMLLTKQAFAEFSPDQ